MEDDRTPELIEAEDIEVTAHKRTRKKKQLMKNCLVLLLPGR